MLAELAAAWSLDRLDDIADDGQSRPDFKVELSKEARDRATTRLFAFMGLHDSVRTRLMGRTLDLVEHEWAASAAWTAGAYEESAAHWALARPGADADSRAIRAERHAAAMWLQGRLRRARRELVVAIDDAQLTGASPEQCVIMAETFGAGGGPHEASARYPPLRNTGRCSTSPSLSGPGRRELAITTCSRDRSACSTQFGASGVDGRDQ